MKSARAAASKEHGEVSTLAHGFSQFGTRGCYSPYNRVCYHWVTDSGVALLGRPIALTVAEG